MNLPLRIRLAAASTSLVVLLLAAVGIESYRTFARQLHADGIPLAPLDATLHRDLRLLEWALPIACSLAALGAWWMAGVALAPLSRVARAASTIDVNRLSARLPVRGAHDELDELARAFNGTLSRLEHAVAEMRQFSAALAHELRTPLAALRGEIELTLRSAGSDEGRRRALESQLEELDRLNRLIDQILTVARAESGQIRLTFAPVDLAEAGSAIVEQLEPIAQSRGIELLVERAGPTIVEGDAGWLERLILNLLDNALKFTGVGGRVTLRVSSQPGGAQLDVADTGAGIASDAMPHLFEPFFRADEARSPTSDGAGLGLSLVQWIVSAHHGRIVVTSHRGAGSTFAVWLPATQQRPEIGPQHERELMGFSPSREHFLQ